MRGINIGGGQFSYYSTTWSAGWVPMVLDFNGDGRSDVFLYNPADGRWNVCLTVGTGDFQYQAGQWSPGWQIYPMDWNGNGHAGLFLYSVANGAWFRVIRQSNGL